MNVVERLTNGALKLFGQLKCSAMGHFAHHANGICEVQ